MKKVFDIKIDFEKVMDLLYDKKTNSEYLDFFGVFSSLILGYNHSIFDRTFKNKIFSLSKIRMIIICLKLTNS